jgi:hypothetical protein
MAVKQSTGFRNARLSGDSVRKIFADAKVETYSGTAPASADDAATGTKLIIFTKASGPLSAGEVSTAKEATHLITSHAVGETFSLVINGTTYTYLVPAEDATAIEIAARLAALVDVDPAVEACAGGTATIYIRSTFPGVTFTITKAGTGTTTLVDDAVANAISDGLKFLAASAGVMSKNTDVWSGVGLAEGTAGYCRMVTSSDDGTLSTTQKRLQGNAGTSGTEMTLTSINIHVGATNTLDTATITEPASA